MAPRPSLLLALAALFVACKSADDYAADADREAYGLIADQRAQLFDIQEEFSIDPREDSLRQRILRGEDARVQDLDLLDCLEIAAENNRDYQTRRESLYRSALALALQRFNFGWIPAAGADGTVVGAGGTGTSQAFGANGALTRILGSGAVIVADVGLSFLNLASTGDGFDAVSDLGLSVTQPLLRGFGKRIVREPLTQSERNLVYEARSYERFRRTFAIDVTGRVYRIVQQMNVVDNERSNIASLELLRQRNEARSEAGLLSDIEVDQARQDELRSRNRLLDVERDLQQLLDDFKLFLGLPIDTPLTISPQTLDGLLAQGVQDLGLTEGEIIETGLQLRLDRMTTLDRIIDAERQVYITADALRAGLGLDARVEHISASGRPASLNADTTIWAVGLDLDLPIGNLPERNAHRLARIDLQASLRAAQEQADSIRVDLRDSMRLVNTRQQSYELSTVSVELAERRVESAKLSLEAGRASTRDLLEAQEDLLAAQNDATRALIDYSLSRLELYRDMEILVVDEEGVRPDPTLILEPGFIQT